MRHSTATYETIKIDNDVNMRYSCCTDYNFFVPMHWHDSIEVIYVLSGESIIRMEQQAYTLKPNDFIIIDSNIIHSTQTRERCNFLLIQIPYQFLQTYIPDITYMHFKNVSSVSGISLTSAASTTQLPDEALQQNFRNIFLQLVELWHTRPDGYRLKYYSCIFELLYIMICHFRVDITQTEYRQTEKYRERLTQVMDYVKLHYREPISTQDISRDLALNPSYFTRFFRKYMNMTFTEYLNTIRLHGIYNDIITTDLPIQTITERNGFTNYKLFMRMFRQTYGCTPSQKRKELNITAHPLPLP